MTIATSYPGVYIKELPSGVRTISNVSTSVTAFVGYTARGLDHTPTTVLSFADFERNFGGLASDSELSYCIKHFFDNGGSQAIVVRVPKSDAVSASVTVKDKVVGGNEVLQLTAISKGEWGNNIAVNVDYYSVAATETQVFNMTVKDLATGIEERHLNLSMKSGSPRNVESVINNPDDGSSLIRAKVIGVNPNRPAETGTVSGDIELAKISTSPKNDCDLKVLFSNMDAWMLKTVYSTNTSINNRVVFGKNTSITVKSIHSLCRQFEANLNQQIAETHFGVRIRCMPSSSGKGLRVFADIDPQRYKNYSPFDNIVTFQAGTENNDNFYETLKLNSASSNVSWYLLGQGNSTAGAQSKKEFGKDGIKPPVTNDLVGKELEKTGLQALNSVDIFNLLCVPDATRSDPNNRDKIDSGLSPLNIFLAAAKICEKKRAFLIVDPTPDVSDPSAALKWKGTVLVQIASKNSAAYFPRIEVPDPLNDFKPRSHPPCGVIAGLYARTDAERGVWKAPAGTDSSLRGVQGLTYNLDDKENGRLNPHGINCLRKLPTYGSVAWGTRTILGADALSNEWKYIPVRRLALFIEESLYRGTQWIVFEPNDEPLWSQVRLNIGAFMQSLYRQGAFAGKSPRDAYEVRCDKSTTTPDDINRGIVNILVKFKPLFPAEFVVIKIQQMAGQTMV